MTLLLVLPVAIPLAAAGGALLFWRWRLPQRWLGMIGTAGLAAAGVALLDAVWRDGIQTVQLGAWPAPFGISFVADTLSATLVVMAGLMGFAIAVYSLSAVDRRREAFGYYPLLLVLLAGICGAFLTGDIFNLFVWFEVIMIGSFVLLTLGGERAQMEGGVKYVALALVSSFLFLSAVGILYGTAGTLNMAELSEVIPRRVPTGLATTLAVLFMIAFGIKAAAFPLFFWLPASYHTPPAAVSAIFAGLLTKVGVYALLRVFTLIFVQDPGYTHAIILTAAGLTMVVGIVAAISQTDLRRVFSFNLVSHIGFMLMGMGIFTPLALAGTVFYVVHDIAVKTCLFLVGGLMYRASGSYDLRCMGGLYQARPLLAVLFFIPAMSLAGIPPLSGFFAKLPLVQAGLAAEQYAIVAAALVASLLTLYSMSIVWAEAFWRSAPETTRDTLAHVEDQAHPALLLAPVVALAAMMVLLGIAAGPAFAVASRAAEELSDPSRYVAAVLGARP